MLKKEHRKISIVKKLDTISVKNVMHITPQAKRKIMSNLSKDLEKYFAETPIDVVIQTWEKVCQDQDNPKPYCKAGNSYETCHLHTDNMFGCIDCGNFRP